VYRECYVYENNCCFLFDIQPTRKLNNGRRLGLTVSTYVSAV